MHSVLFGGAAYASPPGPCIPFYFQHVDVPDTTQEIRIFGTDVYDAEHHSLVFDDTKLQTLDRRVGRDRLYFDRGLFEQSLAAWDAIPVIYQKDGVHPTDFAGVAADPAKAAEAVGGKLVGHVEHPHIVVEGGARLMASLVIDSGEEEIVSLWTSGKLVPSTAFNVYSNGDRITSPPEPNHVLLFPYVVDRVLPGDPGAYVNSVQEESPMSEEPIDGTEPIASSPDEELVQLNEKLSSLEAENAELKQSLAGVAALREELSHAQAEIAAYQRREENARFARVLEAVPYAMKASEQQIASLRERFETDPVSLLMSVIEHRPKPAVTESVAAPYVNSAPEVRYTTVGDLSTRGGF